MQSKKVLVMPISNPNRKSQLRREESPPYPEFVVELLREFSKAISGEISPMREDVGVMKHTMGNLESQLKTHGERLETILGMKHSIATLETASEKQGARIEKIEGHVTTEKAIVKVLSVVAAIIGGSIGIVEMLKYAFK